MIIRHIYKTNNNATAILHPMTALPHVQDLSKSSRWACVPSERTDNVLICSTQEDLATLGCPMFAAVWEKCAMVVTQVISSADSISLNGQRGKWATMDATLSPCSWGFLKIVDPFLGWFQGKHTFCGFPMLRNTHLSRCSFFFFLGFAFRVGVASWHTLIAFRLGSCL